MMRRRSLLVALLAACLMLFTGGNVFGDPGGPDGQTGGPREGECEDGLDNDEDGLTDADDPACQQPGCLPSSQTPRKCLESDLDPENPEAGNCDDGIDNDGDGLTDREDPDCQEPEGPPGDETCSDGIDNDGDGAIDDADTDCQEECTDTDGDGVCDEDDDCPDVAGTLENGCSPEGPPGNETCSDMIDNDGDGATDADDTDCQEECTDTDGDGVCDEDDDCPDVAGTLENGCSPEGPPGNETCSDGIDNDGDGAIDDADTDCQEVTAENLCTAAAGDPGLLVDDTLGQTIWDGGADALSPLTEDPERNGAISGPLGEALTGTELEVVGDEASCALDLLLDENTFPDL